MVDFLKFWFIQNFNKKKRIRAWYHENTQIPFHSIQFRFNSIIFHWEKKIFDFWIQNFRECVCLMCAELIRAKKEDENRLGFFYDRSNLLGSHDHHYKTSQHKSIGNKRKIELLKTSGRNKLIIKIELK